MYSIPYSCNSRFGNYDDGFYLTKKFKSLNVYHMEDTLKIITAVLITASVLSLTAVFLYIGNIDINKHAVAQLTTQDPFPNNTETIESLDKLLGNNTAIILNDTRISNPNNTLLDSISINLKENCMTLPNSNHLYCP